MMRSASRSRLYAGTMCAAQPEPAAAVTPQRISGVLDIADRFDVVVLDAWGVLNRGAAPIASAQMYSWSPSLTAAWHRLLEWVAAQAAVPLTVLDQSQPRPLDELWLRQDLGCVFMCGYPWALREDRPPVLAAPIPSPARYGARPVYFTILISHVVLAAAIVPLVIITLTRALSDRFDRHRAIARWTFPLWLYVSVTGVLVYFMLYHWFAA